MNATNEPIVEHAGSGFAMPESMARKIDELAQGLPADFTYRRLSASPAEFAVEEGERTDVSYITTDAVDRDGEVVLPGGGDWKNFNRVVPFAHDYKSLPVGSNWWIRPKSKGAYSGLIAKTHYPTKPADWGDAPWLPSAVLHLMQQAVPSCTGKSIGFLPTNIREATVDEKSRRPDLKGRPIIDKWVGLEYSVVPVPCNDTAEMVAVSKAFAGFADHAAAEVIAKAMGVSLKDAPAAEIEKTAEQVAAEKAADREARIAQLLATPDSFITAEDYLSAQRRAAVEQARQHAQAFLTMRSGRV